MWQRGEAGLDGRSPIFMWPMHILFVTRSVNRWPTLWGAGGPVPFWIVLAGVERQPGQRITPRQDGMSRRMPPLDREAEAGQVRQPAGVGQQGGQVRGHVEGRPVDTQEHQVTGQWCRQESPERRRRQATMTRPCETPPARPPPGDRQTLLPGRAWRDALTGAQPSEPSPPLQPLMNMIRSAG